MFDIFFNSSFLKKYIITLVAFLSKKGTRQVYSFLILCFFTILIILFNSPRLEFNLTLLADFVIAFLLVTFSLINVRQENKTEELNAYYSDLFEYSKLNDTVIKNYKIAHHEHKNQLLIIKGMLKEKREEVEEYIDDLLEENKKVDSNGFAELNYLSIPGVKSFIYYKLDQMKQIGTMIELVISPELADVDLSTIDREQIRELYTILGVILDNIIDALKETEEKLVSIQLYKEDCFIYGEFANSFVGDIDLEKLTVLGYTTKGEQHGVGLCLVDDIIKRSSIYEVRAKIVDQFFVQQVRVDLSKTKKHKK